MQCMFSLFYKGGPVETCQELSQAASLPITQYEGHSTSISKSKCCTSSCSDNATGAFKTNILQGMKYDRILLVVRQDPLIVTFGMQHASFYCNINHNMLHFTAISTTTCFILLEHASFHWNRGRLPSIAPLPILKQVVFSKSSRPMARSFHLTICCLNKTSLG